MSTFARARNEPTLVKVWPAPVPVIVPAAAVSLAETKTTSRSPTAGVNAPESVRRDVGRQRRD